MATERGRSDVSKSPGSLLANSFAALANEIEPAEGEAEEAGQAEGMAPAATGFVISQ